MKFLYTKDMITDIVLEICRRHCIDRFEDGIYTTKAEADDAVKEKLQGAYGAVMKTAQNWPQCVDWFIEAEEKYLIQNCKK